MINIYFILDRLSSETENKLCTNDLQGSIDDIISKDQAIEKEHNIFSFDIPEPHYLLESYITDIEDKVKLYLITRAGDIMEIQDYKNNYKMILDNLEQIKELTKEQVKNDLDEYRDKGNNLIHLDFSSDTVDCIRGSVIKSTYYSICEDMIDSKSESLQEKITEMAEEETEEDIKNIKTELDMVNLVVDKYLKGDKDKLEIKKCIYNGKEISPEEILYKLHSHTLPEYLEQIDIRTTLDDTYTIETNLGDIYREPKTGKIYALSPEDKEKNSEVK